MPAGNDEFQDFLDRAHHDQPDRHRFGDALLLPDTPTSSFPGDSGDPGESEAPARADHRHEREGAGPADPAPVGMMGIWPTGTPPTGWLECDGRALSRSTYNDLFDRIGTSWGVGDGTTTFNIPDLRDAFPMGRSGTNIIASSGGSASTSHNHSGVTSGPSADVAVQSGADTDVATDAHNHTISSSVLDNRPPYKAVLFIIKVTI